MGCEYVKDILEKNTGIGFLYLAPFLNFYMDHLLCHFPNGVFQNSESVLFYDFSDLYLRVWCDFLQAVFGVYIYIIENRILK